MNPDAYYRRTEVSNSDLTALKQLLHPSAMAIDEAARQKAFRFGTLFDALVTEPHRVNHYRLTVDGEEYPEEYFLHAQEMLRSLRLEARADPFLSRVLSTADTQHSMARERQEFQYGGFRFALPTRCKWDWWFPAHGFGGDLKTTAASTQREFEECIDFFDWDRSRAWYMDIASSTRDFIYAVSKKNCRVFKAFITSDGETYRHGREKYEELAFQHWCLSL